MDWWSFGILVYELLYGFTPFRGKKREETFENILKRPLQFPDTPEVSKECKVRAVLFLCMPIHPADALECMRVPLLAFPPCQLVS